MRFRFPRWSAMAVVSVLSAGGMLAGADARAGLLFGLVEPGGPQSTLAVLDTVGYGVVSGLTIGGDVGGITVSPGIGVTPRGTIIGATGPGSPNSALVAIDRVTGAVSAIGSFGQNGHSMAAIAFAPDGTLYGWLDDAFGDLYTIDPATGAAAKVGELGLDTPVTGLAIDSTGRVYVTTCCGASGLFLVDPTTGAVTSVAPYDPDSSILALAFTAGDALIGVRASGPNFESRDVVAIDPIGGGVTSLGGSVASLRALAFDTIDVTEPSGAGLFMAGLAGLWLRRARRPAWPSAPCAPRAS